FAALRGTPAANGAALPAPAGAARRLGMRLCFNWRPPVGGGPGRLWGPHEPEGVRPQGRQTKKAALVPVERRLLFPAPGGAHKVDFRTRVRQRPRAPYVLTVHGHAGRFALQTLRASNPEDRRGSLVVAGIR